MDVVVGGPDVAAALLESREKLAPAVVVQVRSEKKFGVRQNYDKISSPVRSRTHVTHVTLVTLSGVKVYRGLPNGCDDKVVSSLDHVGQKFIKS